MCKVELSFHSVCQAHASALSYALGEACYTVTGSKRPETLCLVGGRFDLSATDVPRKNSIVAEQRITLHKIPRQAVELTQSIVCH